MPLKKVAFNAHKKQFAFNRELFTVTSQPLDNGRVFVSRRVEALVFLPQRNGRIAAHLGVFTFLMNLHNPADTNTELTFDEVLELHSAGNQFTSLANWDGSSVFYARGLHWFNTDMYNRSLAILKPALENYSEVPEGFDGWYAAAGKRVY